MERQGRHVPYQAEMSEQAVRMGARTRAITPSGYAAFVIDIDNRVRLGLLTGWGASGSAPAGFVLAAPGQAIHDRKPAKGAGLIAYSGSQIAVPGHCVHGASGGGRDRAIPRVSRRTLNDALAEAVIDHVKPMLSGPRGIVSHCMV